MTRSGSILAAALLASITIPAPAMADELDWADHQYKDVYIRATDSMLYIMRPEQGDIVTLRRAEVPDSAWRISDDAQHREARLAAWKTARGEATAAEQTPRFEAPRPTASENTLHGGQPDTAARARGRSSNRDTGEDKVPYLRLKGVPLGEALQATLRPLNLDYTVEPGYIYISSPERLRKQAREPITTQHYALSGGVLETLPKIVVHGVPVTSAQGQTASGGGFGGASGGGGFQSGLSGRSAAPAAPELGRQGGFGGQGIGGGAGGFNRGGAGLQPDVTSLSNISELFTNIDDRRVGEPLAVVGTGLFFAPDSRRDR